MTSTIFRIKFIGLIKLIPLFVSTFATNFEVMEIISSFNFDGSFFSRIVIKLVPRQKDSRAFEEKYFQQNFEMRSGKNFLRYFVPFNSNA